MSSNAAKASAAVRPLRVDARRNRERIMAAAAAAFAKDGAEASLEDIARKAGVGSATLHRHFASRHALLEAVFHEGVESLRDRAQALAREVRPEVALTAWLREVGTYVASTRGLAASMLPLPQAGAEDQAEPSTCYAMLAAAGSDLLDTAVRAGMVRPQVAIDDLLTLVNAISLVTERHPQGPAEADRLLELMIEGIRR
ncbi:TetR/AcrR family transcriptional regulator [Dactylosporangium sp. CA-092794]|uniref:TetR/AcrR family transcriptional regulator n=1 Tax=Dactylosporangium sp. CA-092794 TaxID=3239929 RepID=UPI003D8B0DDB